MLNVSVQRRTEFETFGKSLAIGIAIRTAAAFQRLPPFLSNITHLIFRGATFHFAPPDFSGKWEFSGKALPMSFAQN
jgi:hypothetical protein